MSLLSRNRDLINSIVADIDLKLRERESFYRASAMDRFNGIRIVGFLTVVPNYSFIGLDIDEEDLKNPEKIVNDFIMEWCKSDDQDSIRIFQQFIKDGERWGWN